MSIDEAQRRFAENPTAEMLDAAAIMDLYRDPAGMEDFLRKWYMDGFVNQGAGKVKFLQGRAGSGKTHFLLHLALKLREDGYQVVYISAKQHRMAAIDELYRAAAEQIAWPDLLQRASLRMIQEEMGYREFSGEVNEIWTWAEANRGRSRSSLHSDMLDISDRWIRKWGLETQWATVMRQWMLRRLEPAQLENPGYERWLKGEKLLAADRKSLPASSNIDRHNARAMLISLASFYRAAGYQGLAVLIDDGQVMAVRNRQDSLPYYTRTMRDQAYEMWRELIDDSHHAAYLFIMLAGSEVLFTDVKLGFPSYPALWARLQSEISLVQVNRFGDLIDWDRLWSTHKETLNEVVQIWRAKNFQGVREALPLADLQQNESLEWSEIKQRIASELQHTLAQGEGQ